MNIEARGNGFLHEDTMMRMMLNYLYSKNDSSMLDIEKFFILSREKEFSQGFCHSLICKI